MTAIKKGVGVYVEVEGRPYFGTVEEVAGSVVRVGVASRKKPVFAAIEDVRPYAAPENEEGLFDFAGQYTAKLKGSIFPEEQVVRAVALATGCAYELCANKSVALMTKFGSSAINAVVLSKNVAAEGDTGSQWVSFTRNEVQVFKANIALYEVPGVVFVLRTDGLFFATYTNGLFEGATKCQVHQTSLQKMT